MPVEPGPAGRGSVLDFGHVRQVPAITTPAVPDDCAWRADVRGLHGRRSSQRHSRDTMVINSGELGSVHEAWSQIFQDSWSGNGCRGVDVGDIADDDLLSASQGDERKGPIGRG